MERRYGLRDAQWERLEALGLPGHSAHVGVTAKDNRLFVEPVQHRFGNTATEGGLEWHRVY
jgi:hypothetical protein